jgi:hypothetical protein
MKNSQSLMLQKLLSIPLFVELLAHQIALEKTNATSQVVLSRTIKVRRKYQSIRSLFVVHISYSINFVTIGFFMVRRISLDLVSNANTLLYE